MSAFARMVATLMMAFFAVIVSASRFCLSNCVPAHRHNVEWHVDEYHFDKSTALRALSAKAPLPGANGAPGLHLCREVHGCGVGYGESCTRHEPTTSSYVSA